MLKKFFILFFFSVSMLLGTGLAQEEIRNYDFYDLQDFPSIKSIQVNFYRSVKQWIYQDNLDFKGDTIVQTSSVIVYLSRNVEKFAKIIYKIDSKYRIIEINTFKNKYNSKIQFYYFPNLGNIIKESNFSSTIPRENYKETGYITGSKAYFSILQSGKLINKYRNITFNKENKIIKSEVKASEYFLGRKDIYHYNNDESYQIKRIDTLRNGELFQDSDLYFDSKERFLKEVEHKRNLKKCGKVPMKDVTETNGWLYKFDEKGNWIEKTNYSLHCDGSTDNFWRYERKINYSK